MNTNDAGMAMKLFANRREKKIAGFSLVEVAVASFLGVLGFVALSQLIITTISATTLGRQSMVATGYAKGKMEELVAQGFEGFSSGSETVDSYYKISWTNSVGVTDTLKNIDVVVEWTDHRGKEHNVALGSMVCMERTGLEGVSFSEFPVLD